MRRPERWLTFLCASVVLASCARRALELAPPAPDRPWAPATTAGGEIVAGKPGTGEAPDGSYVLPSNRALETIPQAPPQLSPGHAYTLPELIDIAQSNNPATRIAWDEARNAALAAGIAESTLLPSLSAGIIGGYQTGSNRASALGFSSTSNVALKGTISSVSLGWLLFDFGERSSLIDAAKQGSVITNIAFTAAHQQVIYKVSLAFYANAAAQARVETAARALRNTQAVQAAAEARYAHAQATIVDVAQARQATAQARLAEVEAAGSAQDSYIALLSAMGISPLTAMKIAAISDRKLSATLLEPVEQIATAALSRRSDMLTAFAAHQQSLAYLDAARAEFLPKLFLTVTGSYANGSLAVTALPAPGQQPGSLSISPTGLGATVLAGVVVPIYDGGVRDALLYQAHVNVDKSEAALAQTSDDAVQQIVSAANAVKTNLSAYDAAGALATAAQTTFDAALASYRHGIETITTATNAETQLLAAENAKSDAYSNALSAAATLALAAGTLGAAPE